MQLTFGAALLKLKPYFTVLDNQGLLRDFLNRACENLVNETNPKDSLDRVAITAHSNIITLPRQYACLVGILPPTTVPIPIRNQWVEFVLAGGGQAYSDDPASFNSNGVVDMGDGHVTFMDPRDVNAAGCLLRLETDASAAAERAHVTIDLYGTGADGNQIRTETDGARYGEQVTLPGSSGTITTAESFCTLRQLVKTDMQGVLSIYAINPDDATETLIGRIEPGDKSPSFRRYKVPPGPSTDYVFICLLRKQYVEACHDNDVLAINHVGALIDEMVSLQYLRESDDVRCATRHSSALLKLQAQAEKYRPTGQYPPMWNLEQDGARGVGAFY